MHLYSVYDSANVLIEKYIHGVKIDEILCLERNGKSYYYLEDGLGSIRYIVDESGSIVNAYNYSAFGEVISKNENIPNNFLFTGRWLDSESGLYYFRSRMYNPRTGTFLSRDPLTSTLRIFTINVDFLSRGSQHNYCLNNPTNHTDPFGLFNLNVHWNLLDPCKGGSVSGTQAFTWEVLWLGEIEGTLSYKLNATQTGLSKADCKTHYGPLTFHKNLDKHASWNPIDLSVSGTGKAEKSPAWASVTITLGAKGEEFDLLDWTLPEIVVFGKLGVSGHGERRKFIAITPICCGCYNFAGDLNGEGEGSLNVAQTGLTAAAVAAIYYAWVIVAEKAIELSPVLLGKLIPALAL